MNEEVVLKKELEIEAKLKNLATISQFIVVILQELDETLKIPDKTIFQIQMAVDEACSNIIIHGYPQKVGKIIISIHIIHFDENNLRNKTKIIIKIIDNGKKWDINEIPPADIKSDLEIREIGGLGVFFMKKFIDQIKYSSKNGLNELKLIKFIKE